MTYTNAVLESIRQEMQTLPGHLGFYYHDLVTGQTFDVNGQDAFTAASVIKLPILLHVLQTLDLDERITVTDAHKVPICGALTLFTGAVQADVRTLCRLMISLSDNTATNALIRRCGLNALAEGFRDMGLERTRLGRLLFDSQAAAAGVRNTICPQEIGMLLQKLHEGAFAPHVCRDALDMLMLQQITHKLDGKLCGSVPMAHKTGEDDGVSHDVGIVYAKQPFVICFAGEDTDVYRWEDLMRRAAFLLAQG